MRVNSSPLATSYNNSVENNRTAVTSDNDVLFKTPNPIRRMKTTNQNDSTKENKVLTAKSYPVSGYISLSDSEGSDSECGLADCVTPAGSRHWSTTSESSIESSGSCTPNTPTMSVKPRTPLSVKVTQPRVPGTSGSIRFNTPQPKRQYSFSFLRSLSNTTDDELRDPDAKR